jgi:hypothetical protein
LSRRESGEPRPGIARVHNGRTTTMKAKTAKKPAAKKPAKKAAKKKK